MSGGGEDEESDERSDGAARRKCMHRGRQADDHANWEAMRARLVAFKALPEHGHCMVPAGYAANPQLAYWVQRQRGYKRKLDAGHRKPGITNGQVARLEALDFEWSTRTLLASEMEEDDDGEDEYAFASDEDNDEQDANAAVSEPVEDEDNADDANNEDEGKKESDEVFASDDGRCGFRSPFVGIAENDKFAVDVQVVTTDGNRGTVEGRTNGYYQLRLADRSHKTTGFRSCTWPRSIILERTTRRSEWMTRAMTQGKYEFRSGIHRLSGK